MAALNLKTIQKYRGTLILISGLVLLTFTAFLIWSGSNRERAKQPPLDPQVLPPTAPFSSGEPELIPWDQIRIGEDRSKIEQILQKEREENTGENTITTFYKTTTPHSFHKVIYENNKAVHIERFVNERKERIAPNYYRSMYGNGEVLRRGQGNIWQLEAFRITNDEYIVLEFDVVYNQTYKIYNLTKARYDLFKQNYINQFHEFYSNDDAI